MADRSVSEMSAARCYGPCHYAEYGSCTRPFDRRDVLRSLLIATASLACAAPASAQGAREDFRRNLGSTRADRRAYRQAVRRGEAQPLRLIIRNFRDRIRGQIVDIRHRRRGDLHFFAFKVLAPDGRLDWYVVNAATEEIMTLEEARARYGAD